MHNSSNSPLNEILGNYSLENAQGHRGSINSRHATPPLTSDTTLSTTSAESGWHQFQNPKFGGPGGGFGGSGPFKSLASSGAFENGSGGPPTRRSSMASNVHSLLNPAETAERAGEGEEYVEGESGTKRRRAQ
jgi:hypothetical protein